MKNLPNIEMDERIQRAKARRRRIGLSTAVKLFFGTISREQAETQRESQVDPYGRQYLKWEE